MANMAAGDPQNHFPQISSGQIQDIGKALEETINDYLARREVCISREKNKLSNRICDGAIFTVHILLGIAAFLFTTPVWEQKNIRLAIAISWPITVALVRYFFSEHPGIAKVRMNIIRPHLLRPPVIAMKTIVEHVLFLTDLAVIAAFFYVIPIFCKAVGVVSSVGLILFPVWLICFTGFLPNGLVKPNAISTPVFPISTMAFSLVSLGAVNSIPDFKTRLTNLSKQYPALHDYFPAGFLVEEKAPMTNKSPSSLSTNFDWLSFIALPGAGILGLVAVAAGVYYLAFYDKSAIPNLSANLRRLIKQTPKLGELALTALKRKRAKGTTVAQLVDKFEQQSGSTNPPPPKGEYDNNISPVGEDAVPFVGATSDPSVSSEDGGNGQPAETERNAVETASTSTASEQPVPVSSANDNVQ